MGRKRGTKELRQEKTVIIGAGITEQWYFSHLKTLFKLNILIRPRFFGKENIAALEKRIKQVLEARNKAIVVFDADISVECKDGIVRFIKQMFGYLGYISIQTYA